MTVAEIIRSAPACEHHAKELATCDACAYSRAEAVVRNQEAAEGDLINPAHYKVNGLECIDVIEALGLNFHLATAFKYLWRAGRKGSAVEDVKKARWYLDRWISNREKKR